MNDRELLEMAAKAAGIAGHFVEKSPLDGHPMYSCGIGRAQNMYLWNPLTDDGDALRLAVDLSLDVHINQNHVEIFSGDLDDCIDQLVFCGDARSATRRAITRSAAEIGRAMP